VPGIVAIEQYDLGGEGVAYHDTTAGNQENILRDDDVDIVTRSWDDGYLIGYIDEGEWLSYTVNVEKAGVYDVEFLVYTKNSGRSLTLQIDGENACAVQVPAGGDWKKPLKPTAQVTFPTAGEHVVTLTFAGGDMNVGSMTFTFNEKLTANNKKTTLPGILQVEDYDVGGEGITYHDTTIGNAGKVYRTDNVDIQYHKGEQSFILGWVADGEWLKYTVYIADARTYTANFRVASPNPGGTLTLQVDGKDACTIVVPKTGSWNTYGTVTGEIDLPFGVHVLTLVCTGDPDINYIKFV
jgi:hypothetical protein